MGKPSGIGWKRKPSYTRSPKAAHVLYKLSDGANGAGIDAVWRAEGHNGGKPYAIVEAKATRDEDAPKFMRKINNTRKPSITSTLGVNGITDPSELIEPLEDEGQSPTENPTKKKGGGKTGGGKGGKATTPITGQSGKIEKTGSSSREGLHKPPGHVLGADLIA